MILNFKVELMKDGIHRVYNNFGKEKLSKQNTKYYKYRRVKWLDKTFLLFSYFTF